MPLTKPTYAVNNIQSLPTLVEDQEIELKTIYDKTGADTKTYLEDLCDELDTHNTAATIDHPDKSVTTDKLDDGAVTTTKIADGAVTAGKLATTSAAKVYLSNNYTYLANSTVAIPFNSEVYDTHDIHDNVTNNHYLTCKINGLYSIKYKLLREGTGTNTIVNIIINSTSVSEVQGGLNQVGVVSLSDSIDCVLSENDDVYVVVTGSVSNFTIYGGIDNSSFSMSRIGS